MSLRSPARNLLLLLLACWCGAGAHAAKAPLPPKPNHYVNDQAALLDVATAQRLEGRLESFERETTNQILVATFPRLSEGEALEDYTVRVAQHWGTGQEKRKNGIIVFIFRDDHKIRIEVGYGLEPVVPDSIAALIIENEITPHFRAGQYGQGVEAAVNALIAATRGEYQGTGKTHADSGGSPGGYNWVIVLILLGIVGFVVWSNSGDTIYQRGGRSVIRGGFNILSFALTSGGGGSGGGGGSSGGYSGGGGSFGGGGASGSW